MLKQKLRPPSHWERQVAKYQRKAETAQSPTQRAYAQQMQRAAEKSLLAARNGVDAVAAEEAVDLDASEYHEI